MILIVSKNQIEVDQISTILEDQGYASENPHAIDTLDWRLKKNDVLAAFIDIDTVPVDNRSIRNLTLKYPSVSFFCMSLDKFHPELKDAICYHIYACMNKPIDPDELIYWLRCIESDENESRGPPIDGSTTQSDEEA